MLKKGSTGFSFVEAYLRSSSGHFWMGQGMFQQMITWRLTCFAFETYRSSIIEFHVHFEAISRVTSLQLGIKVKRYSEDFSSCFTFFVWFDEFPFSTRLYIIRKYLILLTSWYADLYNELKLCNYWCNQRIVSHC